MSAGKTFIDTNVLLYGADARDPRKQRIAQARVDELGRGHNAFVSNQVMKELASNLLRKFGKSPSEVGLLCSKLSTLRIVPEGHAELQESLRIMTTSSISFWDACIVATAKAAGCSVLLTEDLSHGQTVSGVRIENPFA